MKSKNVLYRWSRYYVFRLVTIITEIGVFKLIKEAFIEELLVSGKGNWWLGRLQKTRVAQCTRQPTRVMCKHA